MDTNCGLKKETIDKVTKSLRVLLADIHQLYIKTLAYHWNVEDPRFAMLHEFFEMQYLQLAKDLDIVAERIRKLGEKAPGSIEQLSSLKRLKDTEETQKGDRMIEILASDYETLIVQLRKDISSANDLGDHGTGDLLIGILRHYEKQDWMLRSHL